MRFYLVLALGTLAIAGCFSEGPRAPDAPDSATTGPALPADVDRPVDLALARVGQWLAPVNVEEPPIHATVLPDGRLLIFAGLHAHGANGAPFVAAPANAETRVQDFSTGTVSVLTPTPSDGGASDLFCSDQTLLPDGRVVAFGGTRWAPLPDNILYGTPHVRSFDPATNTWTQHPDMSFDRWYPSSLALPDGRVLVASGISDVTDQTSMVEEIEVFDPTTNQMTVLPASANRDLPMYPRLYVAPSGPLKGDVFFQPGGCLWCPSGVTDGEAAWNSAASLDLDTMEWTTHGRTVAGVRNAPVTVMMALEPPNYEARILTAAGTLTRTGLGVPLAEMTDLSVDPPTHTLIDPMAEGRWFASHTLLPDGSVVVTGGAKHDGVLAPGTDNNPASPVLETEIFTPNADGTAGTWSTVAPMTIPRVYHSTSLLLPDGRVWVAGSVPAAMSNPASEPAREEAIEVYEPPYLFRGPRPVISAAPAAATWGQSFDVETPDAAVVTPVLMRAGTVTHVYNPEQRLIELVVTGRSDGTVTIQAPPDAALAPPGHYMLFLLKATENGPVPSVASMLRLG